MMSFKARVLCAFVVVRGGILSYNVCVCVEGVDAGLCPSSFSSGRYRLGARGVFVWTASMARRLCPSPTFSTTRLPISRTGPRSKTGYACVCMCVCVSVCVAHISCHFKSARGQEQRGHSSCVSLRLFIAPLTPGTDRSTPPDTGLCVAGGDPQTMP